MWWILGKGIEPHSYYVAFHQGGACSKALATNSFDAFVFLNNSGMQKDKC